MFFFFSIFVYVKKPVGFFFRRITTYGRDSPPLRKAEDTPISGSCVHKRMPKLAVDGCCEAAAYGIRPSTPWIWGFLNFRSIRVKNPASEITSIRKQEFTIPHWF